MESKGLITAGLALALWSPGAAADCAGPTGVAELAVQLGRAEQAFVEMDPAGFRTQRELARETWTCLGEVVSPSTAEAYHQLEALDAFLVRDNDGATRAFQAVLQANPRYALSADLAPEGHPLWQLVQDAKGLPPGEVRELEPPAGLTLRVDGRVGTQVYDALPTILQLTNADYEVLWTGYQRVGASDPDWSGLAPAAPPPAQEPPPAAETAPAPAPATTEAPAPVETAAGSTPAEEPPPAEAASAAAPLSVPAEPVSPTARRPVGLVAGAGISALATGGLWLVANNQHDRYVDADSDEFSTRQELERVRNRNRVVVAGSAVTGAAAVALTLGAAVTWRF